MSSGEVSKVTAGRDRHVMPPSEFEREESEDDFSDDEWRDYCDDPSREDEDEEDE